MDNGCAIAHRCDGGPTGFMSRISTSRQPKSVGGPGRRTRGWTRRIAGASPPGRRRSTDGATPPTIPGEQSPGRPDRTTARDGPRPMPTRRPRAAERRNLRPARGSLSAASEEEGRARQAPSGAADAGALAAHRVRLARLAWTVSRWRTHGRAAGRIATAATSTTPAPPQATPRRNGELAVDTILVIDV
jgi:hypothetical protein